MLRHEVTVARRSNPTPRLGWAGRAVFAALIRRLPTKLRGHGLVTPRTVLRWITAIVTEHEAWRPVSGCRPPRPLSGQAVTRMVPARLAPAPARSTPASSIKGSRSSAVSS